MFNHVMLGANSLEDSKQFYDEVMGVLGYGPGIDHPEYDRFVYVSDIGYLVVGIPNDRNEAHGANGGTIGFTAPDPETIDAWHSAGVSSGGVTCEEPPGIRERGGRKYYAAYLRDPAGNKLSAQCWLDR